MNVFTSLKAAAFNARDYASSTTTNLNTKLNSLAPTQQMGVGILAGCLAGTAVKLAINYFVD